MNNNQGELSEDKEFLKLLKLFWKDKFLITFCSSLFACSTVFYSINLPNFYTSSAILAPSENKDNISNSLNNISGLAALTGIASFNSSDNELIGREIIKSFKFFKEIILPQVKLEDIHAIKKWDYKTNKIIYEKKIFDELESKWVRAVKYPQKKIPSPQESFEGFNNFFNITFDKETTFMIVSITHYSPVIAKEWTEIIINGINQTMRNDEKIKTERSIDFLNNQINNTNLSEIKNSLLELMQQEIKKLMIIESSDEYIYKIIEPPIVPELKSSPNRLIMVLISIVLGFVAGLFISILKKLFTDLNNEISN